MPGFFMREFTDMSDLKEVTVAHLLRPQGRKGELLAELLTDFPERFSGREVRVGAADYTVESYFLPTGRNAGRVVLKFAGVDSINEAEKLNGLEVTIPAEERAPLEEDEAYISDLVGCAVFDGQREVGVVEDVEPSAAGQMLVMKSADGVEHLIPFVKAYLESVDIEKKEIRMTLPEGLIGLNP
jgi:16S rRNA processing protein RimM